MLVPYSATISMSTATCFLPTSTLTPLVTSSLLTILSAKLEKKPPLTVNSPLTSAKAMPTIFWITLESYVKSPLTSCFELLLFCTIMIKFLSFNVVVYLPSFLAGANNAQLESLILVIQ